jgi:hypothetical protein
MARSLVASITFIIATLGLRGASEDRLTFELPPGYSAASYNPAKSSVFIATFLTGPFGGRGTNPRGTSIQLENERGQRAVTAKAILYSPGCEFETYSADVPPQGSLSAKFECRKLPVIPLRGSITGVDRPKGMRLHLFYDANWSHEFLHIADGVIYAVAVAETTVDKKGRFQFDAPDLARDPVHNRFNGDGYFSIVGETEARSITFLPPGRGPIGDIRIQEKYAEAVYKAR